MSMNRRAPSRARLRVLVVDDDPLVRDLLRAVLHDANFVLDEAPDGDEALRLARANPPDVVVLDVMMPGLNGYDVCRALRDEPLTAAARVIMLTARNTTRDRDEGRAAGADAFFTKPFSPLDLIETVTGIRDGAA